MRGDPAAEPPEQPRISSLRAGLTCACPRCGQGRLYAGLLALAKHCDSCGLDYTRLSADDGPAFFIIVGFSAIVLPLAILFEFTVEPPLWAHLLLWPPFVLVGAVSIMRPLKAWLIAQHYRHLVLPGAGGG